MSRARLFVNDDIYSIENDCNITIFDFPSEKDTIGVSIDLNTLLPCLDSVYQIGLDEPGKNLRILTRYVLITEGRLEHFSGHFIFFQTFPLRQK